MKILYITTSLLRNESASIRNISLINGIVENGNEVDILTLDFLEKFEDKFLKTFLTKETKIYKVKIPKFIYDLNKKTGKGNYILVDGYLYFHR